MISLISILVIVQMAVAANSLIIDLPNDFDIAFTDMYIKGLKNETDCSRKCISGKRRLCYYKMTVENYQALGAACGNCSRGVFLDCFRPQCNPADGFERDSITLNRQIPGPLVDVCHRDLIVVDVQNSLHSDTFSIHWHGMLQRKTPYMDGVPFATQCPITPMNRFRYAFWAEDTGTYFYHSHSGVQRYLGAYGGLIVRRPDNEEILRRYYDKDSAVILISDWTHTSPEMFVLGLPTREPGLLPEALLINGFGKYFDNSTGQFTPTPYETIYLKPNMKHRLRIINAGSTVCPIEIQIQDHNMTIISVDGSSIRPVTVDTLSMGTGERYDVVIDGKNRQGMYWFLVKAIGLCIERRIFQNAVISYNSNSTPIDIFPSTKRTYDGYPRGVGFNDPEAQCGVSNDSLCLTDLKDHSSTVNLNQRPDQKFYLTFGVRPLNTDLFFANNTYLPFLNIADNDIYVGTMNGISNQPPPYPLLSQTSDNNQNLFCEPNHIPLHCRNMEICVCTHVIRLHRNALVEFVLIDEAPSPSPVVHPIHFHGFKFNVLAQKRFLSNTSLDAKRVMDLEQLPERPLKPNNPNAVFKDTISVQNQGVSVIRFVADNPGAWLVHCHVEDHMVFGMGLVLLVGGNVPPVPRHFPRCGNFPF